MDPMEQFRSIAQPPPWALKTIGGGRLKGMTDIKPAWRIQAMTEVYGLCGVGWKYEIVKQWTEPGSEDQVFAFVDLMLYIRVDGEWSAPIPGAGGSMLIEKEKQGPHSNDEAFKMATTDALSSAMKMIGMAADVYAGQWTGSKYKNQATPEPKISDKDEKEKESAKNAIAWATSTAELNAVGEALRDYNPAVQDVVRDVYRDRKRELEAKEKTSANF